jgi:hypothetical protein
MGHIFARACQYEEAIEAYMEGIKNLELGIIKE